MILRLPEMPTMGLMLSSFEPDRLDYLSPEGSGRLGAISAGEPLWMLTGTLNNLSVEDSDFWRAWASARRGPQRHFLGFDPDRRVPRRHLDGRPFTRAASSWSEATDADGFSQLTLNGLLTGTILSLSDYIGFRWDAAGDPAGSFRRRALVRVVAGGFVDGSGSITVAIEPAVPRVVPPGAQAHLDRPACLMRLTPETKLGDQAIGYTSAGGRIVAIQDLLP